MPIVTTRDGTPIYVKDWGSGRPVVLIHGWPLSSDSWDVQSVALAEAGYRVIAYDRRGFGRSGQPWHGYDYDTLSDDLADVMTAMGVAADATIVGFSMGGGEVARYMSRHGGKGVIKAGLIGSVVPFLLNTPDNPDGAPGAVFDGMRAGISADRAGFMAGFLRGFFGVGTLDPGVSEATVNWAWNIAMQAGLRGTLECVSAFGRTDFRPDLPAFTVPTLVLHGTGDDIVPIDLTGRRAAAAIPQSKLVVYEGAPHGLTVTHADRFTQDLIAFAKE